MILFAWEASARQSEDGLLEYRIESTFAASSRSYMPHWLYSNRFGLLEDRGVDGYLLVGIGLPERKLGAFRVSAGFDAVGKTILSEAHLNQYYLTVGYGPFEVSAGRMRQTHGLQYDPLSSGSLMISNNARPIPRITAGIPDYTDIPFTFGLLAIKGQFTHGWLENDRYTKSPWFHEKFVYARGGHESWPFRLYGGMAHYVMWSGVHPEFGQVPNRFQDFLRVIFGKEADEDFEGSQNFPEWVENAIGDHIGMIEYGLTLHLSDFEFSTYRQFPFEDGSGLRFYFNRDALHGITIRKPGSNGFITGFLYEYLNTTWQSGPGPSDPLEEGHPDFDDVMNAAYPYKFGGRDNYYNHYIYRNGWTYFGHTLGNGLLMTHRRGQVYFPGADLGHWMFVSNRVQAHHLGMEGFAGENVRYKAFFTRSRHWGTYHNFVDFFNQYTDPDYPFASRPVQYHTMLELEGRFPRAKRFGWTGAITIDFGDFGTSAGFLGGIHYTLKP